MPSTPTMLRVSASPMPVQPQLVARPAAEETYAAAGLQLQQDEKDARLVELLQFAATHGCDDLEPEPAVALLEEVSWDVTEALERLTGTRRGQGHQSILTQAATDLEHLRMQQEEWDRSLQAEEHHRAALRRAARRAARHAARQDMMARQEALARHQGFALSPQGHDDEMSMENGHMDENSFGGSAPLTLGGQPSAGASYLNNRLYGDGLLDQSYSQEEQEDGMGFHALVQALIRTQDEADLQDAVRLSAEEAYSGSFGAPPVDEVALEQASRICAYGGKQVGESHDDACAICLEGFEKGDSLRVLQCRHSFHLACVDQWLAQSGQCPLCKHSID